MRRRERCIINFNRQHKLFIDKITKLGFFRHSKNLYSIYDYYILIEHSNKYNNILFYQTYDNGGGKDLYNLIVKVDDFHQPNIVKHDVMLNKILEIDIFSRRKKIEKLLKKIR